VSSRNLENEEAKARYGAVKNTTTIGCNARKTNKQTNKAIKQSTTVIQVSLFSLPTLYIKFFMLNHVTLLIKISQK